MSFYAELPDVPDDLQQGDLLSDVPFCHMSLTGSKVQLTTGERITTDQVPWELGVEFVSAKAVFGWAMVLSQTCDVQTTPTGSSRKPIVLARVCPIKALVPNFLDDTVKHAIAGINVLGTPGKAPTLLYLPAISNGAVTFPRSGVSLLDVQRFDPEDRTALLGMVKLRLTTPALQALQERLAYCFGRFAAPGDLYYSEEELQIV